jgi:hypothetical protein
MGKEIAWGLFGLAGGIAMMVVPDKFSHMPPLLVDALFYGGIVFAIVFFTIAVWPRGRMLVSDHRHHFKLRKIKDWSRFDRTPSFRLAQWAALIDGYDYHPDPKDDPGYRPWRDTFFFLKRSIESGAFKQGQKPGRATLVSRDDIREFYQTVGEYPTALFPEAR